MIRSLCLFFSLIITSSVATRAEGSNQIEIGKISFGGTGCPPKTVNIEYDGRLEALRVLFDQYRVEAGRTNQSALVSEAKQCSVVIPLRVPAGHQLSIVKAEYNGFNQLPAGSLAKLNVNYQFAGKFSSMLSEKFIGPKSEPYFVTKEPEDNLVNWSDCGAKVNLRVNAGISVNSNPKKDPASSTVNETDTKSGFLYFFRLQECEEKI